MKTNFKNLIALLLVFVMCFSIVACNQTSNSEQTTPAETTPAAPAETTPEATTPETTTPEATTPETTTPEQTTPEETTPPQGAETVLFDICCSSLVCNIEDITFTVNGEVLKGDCYYNDTPENGSVWSYHLFLDLEIGTTVTVSMNLLEDFTFEVFYLRNEAGDILATAEENSITFVVSEDTWFLDARFDENFIPGIGDGGDEEGGYTVIVSAEAADLGSFLGYVHMYMDDSFGSGYDHTVAYQLEEGTKVKLYAEATYGYVFAGWYTEAANGGIGELVSLDIDYTFTVSGDIKYIAHFVNANETYMINVTAGAHADVYVNGVETQHYIAKAMEEVVINVVPHDGYRIECYELDDVLDAWPYEGYVYSIIADGPHDVNVRMIGVSVEFVFETTGVGIGTNAFSIDLDGNYDDRYGVDMSLDSEDFTFTSKRLTTYGYYGETAKIVARPVSAEGYICKSITITHNGETTVVNGSYAEIPQICYEHTYEVEINYDYATYMVNLDSDYGTIYVNGNEAHRQYIKHNQPLTVTAEPDPGYKFVGWYVDDELVYEYETYTFNVTREMSLKAVFEPDWILFGAYVDEDGYTGSGNPQNQFLIVRTSPETGERETIAVDHDRVFYLQYGDEVELIAKPMEGYTFGAFRFDEIDGEFFGHDGYYKWTVDIAEDNTNIQAFFQPVGKSEEDVKMHVDFFGDCDDCYIYLNGVKVTKQMAASQSFMTKDQTKITIVPVECGHCEGFRYYMPTSGTIAGNVETGDIISFQMSTMFCRKVSSNFGNEYTFYFDVCFGYEQVTADMTFSVDIDDGNTGFDVRFENVMFGGEKTTIENTQDLFFGAVLGDTVRITPLNIPKGYEFNYIEVTIEYEAVTDDVVYKTIILDADDFANGYCDLKIEYPGHYSFYVSVTRIVN